MKKTCKKNVQKIYTGRNSEYGQNGQAIIKKFQKRKKTVKTVNMVRKKIE